MSKDDLRLERRDQHDETVRIGPVALTPPVGEDYWTYRVGLSEAQAVIGFPKFGTIGIGFAVEEDWNTNLPYSCSAKEIRKHIWHNRADQSITKEMVEKAVELIRQAAIADRGDPARKEEPK
jgi:hypothetical protein